MKILFLGYGEMQTSLINFLREDGHSVTHYADKLSPELALSHDLIISFGYRHILKQELLSILPREPINLHISLLPYNRGAHPNFWAFHDQTPHGVTIHHIDSGVDTGNIIVQKELFFDNLDNTFKETYETLTAEIENIFICYWEMIRDYNYIPEKQVGTGTSHKVSDLPQFSLGWDAPIRKVLEEVGQSSRHLRTGASSTLLSVNP